MNLILGGMRGVGKTTSGRALASRLDKAFFDTDREMEKRYELKHGQTITNAEIWTSRGEKFFRDLEEEVIHSLKDLKNSIISLGGGTLISKKNKNAILNLGQIVCLFLDKDELKKRCSDWMGKDLRVFSI